MTRVWASWEAGQGFFRAAHKKTPCLLISASLLHPACRCAEMDNPSHVAPSWRNYVFCFCFFVFFLFLFSHSGLLATHFPESLWLKYSLEMLQLRTSSTRPLLGVPYRSYFATLLNWNSTGAEIFRTAMWQARHASPVIVGWSSSQIWSC